MTQRLQSNVVLRDTLKIEITVGIFGNLLFPGLKFLPIIAGLGFSQSSVIDSFLLAFTTLLQELQSVNLLLTSFSLAL